MAGLTSISFAFTVGMITDGGADDRSHKTAQGPTSGNCSAGAKTIGGVGSRKSVYFASFTTPTIWYSVSGYPLSALVRMVLPIAFPVARYRRKKLSFTT